MLFLRSTSCSGLVACGGLLRCLHLVAVVVEPCEVVERVGVAGGDVVGVVPLPVAVWVVGVCLA